MSANQEPRAADGTTPAVDSRRFSLISHGGMRFWNPLPAAALVQLLHELPLPSGADVLDYGCGVGEVCLELFTHHAARITGVDPNPDAIARCRSSLRGQFFAEPFRAQRFAPASFDLVVNIGASPGMARLLGEVTSLLRRSGRLLVGDIYWRSPPSPTLLAFLGAPETPSLDDQRRALHDGGFVIETTLLASELDWDRYEDQYDANMLAYLAAHPDDPSAGPFEARRRAWRAMYLAHGRGTIGFALHLARRAEPG